MSIASSFLTRISNNTQYHIYIYIYIYIFQHKITFMPKHIYAHNVKDIEMSIALLF